MTVRRRLHILRRRDVSLLRFSYHNSYKLDTPQTFRHIDSANSVTFDSETCPEKLLFHLRWLPRLPFPWSRTSAGAADHASMTLQHSQNYEQSYAYPPYETEKEASQIFLSSKAQAGTYREHVSTIPRNPFSSNTTLHTLYV
jgi:hypothetical protein